MKKSFLLGVDVGGTKIEGVLLAPVVSDANNKDHLQVSFGFDHQGDDQQDARCDGYYQVIARERVPTEREKGYGVIIGKIATLAKKLLSNEGVAADQLLGLGVGLPGTIHPDTGKMLNGNTAVLIGKDIRPDLKASLGLEVPVFLENDANCFALAETMCGAGLTHRQKTGQSFSDLRGVGIILGTGCGGGLVVGGKVYSGRNGGASEFGHMTLIDNGHPCYCGRRGCAEQYLSGPAFEAAFNERRYTQVKDIFSAKDIFAKAVDKEPVALAVYVNYQRYLAKFLGNLTCAIDPDFFVLGGGMSTQEIIYDDLMRLVLRRTFLPLDEISIYQSRLGDSSGVIGAAFLPLIQS